MPPNPVDVERRHAEHDRLIGRVLQAKDLAREVAAVRRLRQPVGLAAVVAEAELVEQVRRDDPRVRQRDEPVREREAFAAERPQRLDVARLLGGRERAVHLILPRQHVIQAHVELIEVVDRPWRADGVERRIVRRADRHGDVRQHGVLRRELRHRIEPVRRNHVARERLACLRIDHIGALPRRRIGQTDRRVAREDAGAGAVVGQVAGELRGRGIDAGGARRHVLAEAFVVEEPERAGAAVVDLAAASAGRRPRCRSCSAGTAPCRGWSRSGSSRWHRACRRGRTRTRCRAACWCPT